MILVLVRILAIRGSAYCPWAQEIGLGLWLRERPSKRQQDLRLGVASLCSSGAPGTSKLQSRANRVIRTSRDTMLQGNFLSGVGSLLGAEMLIHVGNAWKARHVVSLRLIDREFPVSLGLRATSGRPWFTF